jgi:hypothetical protein
VEKSSLVVVVVTVEGLGDLDGTGTVEEEREAEECPGQAAMEAAAQEATSAADKESPMPAPITERTLHCQRKRMPGTGKAKARKDKERKSLATKTMTRQSQRI